MRINNLWKVIVAVALIGLAGNCTAEKPRREQTGAITGEMKVAPVQLPERAVEEEDGLGPFPTIKETEQDIAMEEYWDSMELLAICVEAEAGNQGLIGKRLVADVILNRVDDTSGLWADTIEGVITQEGGQFASYWDGGMAGIREPSEETLLAVQMELEERSYPGLYYFREGEWPDYGTPWKKVGDHYFSTK